MPGSIGRAWCVCVGGGLAALLRWQELWHGRSLMTSISNKRLFALLWYCWFLLLLFSLLPGHGGVEGGETPVISCTIRGGRGDPVRLELIHDRGKLASMILCRHGGAISTSSEEAWIRFRYGCSKSLSHEVMRSPWLRDGPWLRIVAGKGLLSNRLWFLGGSLEDADEEWWRCSGTALHEFALSRGAICKKKGPFSRIEDFLGLVLKRSFLQFVPATMLMDKSGSF
jgi:hypothetical protein